MTVKECRKCALNSTCDNSQGAQASALMCTRFPAWRPGTDSPQVRPAVFGWQVALRRAGEGGTEWERWQRADLWMAQTGEGVSSRIWYLGRMVTPLLHILAPIWAAWIFTADITDVLKYFRFGTTENIDSWTHGYGGRGGLLYIGVPDCCSLGIEQTSTGQLLLSQEAV